MAYVKSAEQLADLRAAVIVTRRERNGRAQRSTTRAGQAAEVESRKKETEEQILSVVLDQPHRRRKDRGGPIPKARRTDDGRSHDIDPRDARAGFALGRLLLQGLISQDQFLAGEKYGRLFLRHGYHVTGMLPRFPCQAYGDVAGGQTCAADMGDDEILALRQAWDAAMEALADTFEQRACCSALTSVCVMDRDPGSAAILGSLRVGLNALHMLWSSKRSS